MKRLCCLLGVAGAVLSGSLVGCAPKSRGETGKVVAPAQTAVAVAPATAPAPAPAIINDSCPITTDGVDPTKTATWRGVTIGFCCDLCVREFRDADEKGKDEILAKARAGK